jgi:hypothetical protein
MPFLRLLCLLTALAAGDAAAAPSEGWLPIAPEDLQITKEPKAPAAPAIYLYRQVDRDDTVPAETIYQRIKILTEEGLKYANVEIAFERGEEIIRNIEARTIHPDGLVVDFEGEIYEKALVKSRDVRLMSKTFTLPNVTVGSIVEYRFRRRLADGYVFNSRWLLSEDLFTRHAKFSLKPSTYYALRWSWPLGLPEGTAAPKHERGVVRLETRDVAAFVEEEFMPPETEVKFRVDFIYDVDFKSSTAEEAGYWRDFGKRLHRRVNEFLGSDRVLDRAVAAIVVPEDSPETKLRKLYAHVQQIRNTSYERSKTEQEEQRQRTLEARKVGDVLNRGYGDAYELTWLFLGLARAAGFEADPIVVATRDRYFFDKRLMNGRQLNSNLVVVKLGGRELFLEPGTPFNPYGMLPWYQTAVSGFRPAKDGGSWVNTPQVPAAESRVERNVSVKLTPAGSLEGKLTVTYTGLEASWRRLSQRHEDDAARAEFLENDVERDIPVGVDLTLKNAPVWSASDVPLVAEFDFQVNGWATRAGKRLLVPVGLFGNGEKHTFEHGARVHPLYFRFMSKHVDDITISLPEGWQASSIPKPRSADLRISQFNMTTEGGQTSLHLRRDLTLGFLVVDVKFYSSVRAFFQTVRAADEDQVVVVSGT